MADALGIVCGLFGDSGKGTIVDAYARNDTLIVRFNGGPQAQHYVIQRDGRAHGFQQFGSASFHPGTQTHLSRHMLVYPTSLLEEAEKLSTLGVPDIMQRLTIHRDAPIITPWHRAANWLRELARGTAEHGTCGMGVGELMQDIANTHDDIVFARDLIHPGILGNKLARIRHRKRRELESLIETLPFPHGIRETKARDTIQFDHVYMTFIENCRRLGREAQIVDDDFLREKLAQPGLVIGEGAQGVLLDEWFGFHPHTTWSTTTFANFDSLLSEAGFARHATKIVVLRAYATRHGAGPLVTFDQKLTHELPEQHNRNDGWAGLFRCGWFDLVATNYSLAVLGHVDGIALTCLDRIQHLAELPLCVAYRYTGSASREHLLRFFDLDGSPGLPRITRIRVGRKGDLDHQAALTKHLFQCEPEYISVPRDLLIKKLESELGVSIAISSYGPTAEDKRFHSPLLQKHLL